MKQTTELKRTWFKRKLPGTEPKPKMVSCKECKVRFLQPRLGAKVCSPECAILFSEKQREKIRLAQDKKKRAEAKKERMETRKKLEGMRSRSDWMKLAQVAFNNFVRFRDKDQSCICCDRNETQVDGLGSHGWDCGHYRSVGSAPHMRFIENNAHRQLVFCNRYLSGNAVSYRAGLIKRIGLEAVEALEADNTPRKYSIQDLKEIEAHYKLKLKQLKGKS